MTQVVIRTHSILVNTSLQSLFHQLAMAHNWEALQMLGRASCSVQYLAERLELSEPEISRSLRMLADFGFVEFYSRARKHFYTLARDLHLSMQDNGSLRILINWEMNTSILIELDP